MKTRAVFVLVAVGLIAVAPLAGCMPQGLSAILGFSLPDVDENIVDINAQGEENLIDINPDDITFGDNPDDEPILVQVNTNMGKFIIELDPVKAPQHVQNFLAYVDEGFYEDTLIHRVDRSAGVIQGGGFDLNQRRKEPTRDPVPNEANNGLKNIRGAVGAARTSDPDSATSQWYVNTRDNPQFDPDPDRGAPGFTVFGRVISGMGVVDEIQAVRVGPGQNDLADQETVPRDPVIVLSIERI